MFIWKADYALAEFKHQQPEMYAKLMELAPSVDTPHYETRLNEIWESLPAKSLDYAIMEGAENVTVIPADIGWSDVGAWDALFDILELDSSGNGHKGSGPKRIILDNQNTFVYSDRLTVTIGVDDLIVVDTDDVLLICHKDRVQDVRTIVDQLRATDNERYL
jgi:mannose-1-phosphate guanylyltransferase